MLHKPYSRQLYSAGYYVCILPSPFFLSDQALPQTQVCPQFLYLQGVQVTPVIRVVLDLPIQQFTAMKHYMAIII